MTRKYPPKKQGEKFTGPKEEQVRHPFDAAPPAQEVPGSRSQIERVQGQFLEFPAGAATPAAGVYTCSHCGEVVELKAAEVLERCPHCGSTEAHFLSPASTAEPGEDYA